MFLVYCLSFCVFPAAPVKIDLLDCGVDNDPTVQLGEVGIGTLPWLGMFSYSDPFAPNDIAAATPVALIQKEYCIGAAAEIAEVPRDNLVKQSRVLFGVDWRGEKRRILSVEIHPHYEETYNTLALIHLRDPIRVPQLLRPLCPPPEILTDLELYVVRFKNDFTTLTKEVLSMYYVPPRMCRDFYVAANLYAVKMRPPHVVCACTMDNNDICVWEAGALLVTRDVWGRWQLLGFGVRGPGCASPSRYLDMMSYYPWIHAQLYKYQRFQMSKLHNHKYVLRSSEDNTHVRQNWGDCVDREYLNVIYKDIVYLQTDNNHLQFLTYNLTILEHMEVTCLTMELVRASATADMRIRHVCHRPSATTPACYIYNASVFDLSILVMFSTNCEFKIFVYGYHKNMTLIDILDWKWEEGTYYEDFNVQKIEYHGIPFTTDFGYEPLDPSIWVPDYDLYTTTEFDYRTTTESTSPPPKEVPEPPFPETPKKKLFSFLFPGGKRPWWLFG